MALFVLMRVVYSFLFLILLLASSCRKEKFSYESNWITPLVETTLTLGDLVPDSLLDKNNDSSLNVVYEAEYGFGNLDDILQIPDSVESIEVSLTSLVLEDRSFTDTLTLLELYPPSLLLNGTEASLPAQEITTNEGTVLDVTEQFFTTATFNEGFIDISISNDLPVEAEVLEFELRNFKDKSVIVSGVFNDVSTNSTVSESYDLAGKTVDGVLELIVIKVKTRASNGEVLIDASKGIRTTITIRNLKPQIATAIFPAQNLVERNEEKEYRFGGAYLTELTIKEGYVLMYVESSIEEAIVLNYKIPNSRKLGQGGESIETEWTIPPAPKGEVIIVEERFPIDGFNISLWGEVAGTEPYYNHLYSEVTASIKYSGIERTISLDDKVNISLGLVDVRPSLVYGDPGPHEFTLLDTQSIRFFENVMGTVSLEGASLDLEFFNSFGIESRLDINSISSINTRKPNRVNLQPGFPKSINIEKVSNATPQTPTIQNLRFDNSNSNLKQFFENTPDKIELDLFVKVRPNGTIDLTDFAYDFSELKVNLKLEAPLTIGLDSFALITTENFTLLGENETQNIKEGKLILKVKNSFPFQGDLRLQFVDGQGEVLFAKLPDVGSRMEAAEVDVNTGKTVGHVESELAVSISRSEFQLLKSAEQVEVKVTLNTKDANRFKMYSDYGVEVQLITDFIYENKL